MSKSGSRYFMMDHRGSLDEALRTLQPISVHLFHLLVSHKIYKFYMYDPRIQGIRYKLVDIRKNLGMKVWLIEICD